MQILASPRLLNCQEPAEDEDAEMADHGTDDADDVDPNYDAT